MHAHAGYDAGPKLPSVTAGYYDPTRANPTMEDPANPRPRSHVPPPATDTSALSGTGPLPHLHPPHQRTQPSEGAPRHYAPTGSTPSLLKPPRPHRFPTRLDRAHSPKTTLHQRVSLPLNNPRHSAPAGPPQLAPDPRSHTKESETGPRVCGTQLEPPKSQRRSAHQASPPRSTVGPRCRDLPKHPHTVPTLGPQATEPMVQAMETAAAAPPTNPTAMAKQAAATDPSSRQAAHPSRTRSAARLPRRPTCHPRRGFPALGVALPRPQATPRRRLRSKTPPPRAHRSHVAQGPQPQPTGHTPLPKALPNPTAQGCRTKYWHPSPRERGITPACPSAPTHAQQALHARPHKHTARSQHTQAREVESRGIGQVPGWRLRPPRAHSPLRPPTRTTDP